MSFILRCVVASLVWVTVARSAPFNPSRFSVITGTNYPVLQALSWRVAMDNDTLAAVGFDAATNTSVFVMQRHQGGVDKWNVRAVFQGLATDAESTQVAIAGDILVIADRDHDGVATNGGAVFILMRNHPTADAWGLWKTLYPSNSMAGGGFGVSIATDGRYVAVASGTTNGVYLYERNAGGSDQWGLVKTFPSSSTNGQVSLSVSVREDLLAIGDSRNPTNQVVRLHERNANGPDQWGLLRTLSAADGQTTNQFGYSVALGGRILVVGARLDAGGDGAVYMFERDQGGAHQWGQVAKRQPDPGTDGRMGSSVGVYGDTIASSAPYEAGSTRPDGGSIHVFQRNAGGSNAWGRTARLAGDDEARFLGDPKSGGVAIGNDVIAAGAMWIAGVSGTGGVRLFQEYDCPNWSVLKRITPDAASTNGRFGTAIAFDESFLVAGQPGASINASNEGSHVSFERNITGSDYWGQRLRTGGGGPSATNGLTGTALAMSPGMIVSGAPGRNGSGRIEIRDFVIGGASSYQSLWSSPDNQSGEQFGASVAIWDDVVVAGAPLNSNVAVSAGAAFIFSRNQGGLNNWGFFKRLEASPLSATAEFGRSVAVHRNIAVVGAPYENDLINGLGAVYIFQANQGGSNQWGQVKRIKVPDTGSPYLGWSVSLWGDLLAVGAIGDDDEATDSGAVYLFERNRGGINNWGLLKKIKAPSPQANADFGWSVAVRDGRLIVGEPGRDIDFTDQGRVLVFQRNEGGANQWGLRERINTPMPQLQAKFGSSVALINDRIAAGAPFEDTGAIVDAGAVYMLQPDCLRITTTNDVTSAADGVTSLREAVQLANLSTQSVFTIHIPDGTFVSSNSSAFTVNNMNTKVVFQGQGARRTIIDKAGAGRAFVFISGTTGEVRDLTIKNGQAPHGMDGSGSTNGAKGSDGGGAFVSGNWMFLRCSIVSNTAGNGGNAQPGQGTFAGQGGYGGGVYLNTGRLEIRDCLVAYNVAGDAGVTGDSGNGGGYGGGIANATASLFVLNSTLYGNSAGQGTSLAYPDGNGGGIHSLGETTIRHSTVSHNRAGFGANRGSGGGVFLAEPATLRFSVLNNNVGTSNAPDANATFSSPLYNLISDTNGVTFTGSPVSNIVGMLAQIGGAPANYGGQTDTMMPQPGSPVIDQGATTVANLIVNDQRGFPRPATGSLIDLGATEASSDFDGDSIPDAWEQSYGLDREEPADAAADLDGDSFDGAQEYVMDTNPYGSAPLSITSFVQSGITARVQFAASSNRVYSLQTSTNALAWSPEPSQQYIQGSGGTLNLVHTNNAAVTGYRVIVELP